jgi:hypothetical protein
LQPLQADSESTDVVFSNLPQKFTLRLPWASVKKWTAGS